MRMHGSTKGVTRPPLSRIYPQNLGLLPHYGGYVPGEEYSRGRIGGQYCVCMRMDLRSYDSFLSVGRKGNRGGAEWED